METLNIRDKAKSITDISHVAWELEDPFHNGGNFQLFPMDDGNWFCYMRIFGYFIDGRGMYRQTEKTKLKNPHLHRFCVLDKTFNVKRAIPNAQCSFFQHPQFHDKLPYLEDGRIVAWNRNLYIVSTVVYQTEKGWAALGLELQKIDFTLDGIAATHVWNSLQNGLGGIQKNWLPVPDKPFTFITGTYDGRTDFIDISQGKIGSVGNSNADNLYRGNTPLVKIDNGYVAITHMVDMDAPIKTYRNYMVKYGEDLSVKKISRPFKLTNTEIEFVTTLIVRGDEVLIGVTANDDTPEVHTYDVKTFSDLFENW